MFARCARLPLRRCLHTRFSPAVPKTQLNRLAFVFGVSAATASYLTWHLSSDNHRIALDSSQAGKLSEPRKTTSSSAKNLDSNTEMAPTSAVESNSATTETTKAGSENTPQEDEEEGTPSNSSGGAFNPETGEINWDCPCLGGMAHGPCGPQFREAFSCFVFSEVEPKGMDCVEKFKAMQDCFRAHPDIYADEIMDDEEEEGAPATGEESSAATGIANDEKDSALTASSPRTEPVPRDLPSDTTTPTTSS